MVVLNVSAVGDLCDLYFLYIFFSFLGLLCRGESCLTSVDVKEGKL